MNDTIANRDASQGPTLSKRAGVLARAVLRLHGLARAPEQCATPAEVAIAEGVLVEAPEADESEVAVEHYRAQAVAVSLAERRRNAALWRRLFRDEGERREYQWTRTDSVRGFRIRACWADSVRMLAEYLDNESEARLMLDVAGDIPVRCGGWIVAQVAIRV